MCVIQFRNSNETTCLCDHPYRSWCELRHVLEARSGMHAERCDSVLFGFLKSDWTARVALNDDYKVKPTDTIVVLRCPLPKRRHRGGVVWKPPSVWERDAASDRDYNDQQHREQVRALTDPKQRLETILEYSRQQRESKSSSQGDHPSHSVAHRFITAWRSNEEQLHVPKSEAVEPHGTCQRCMNLLSSHDTAQCPTAYTLAENWRWLSKCRPPTGVPAVCRVKVDQPTSARDLQHVQWVDGDGVAWKPRCM